MAVRLTTRVPDDVNEKINFWCKRLSVSKTQFTGICIQAGIESVVRGISPVDSLTDEQLARVLKVGAAAGVVFNVGEDEASS